MTTNTSSQRLSKDKDEVKITYSSRRKYAYASYDDVPTIDVFEKKAYQMSRRRYYNEFVRANLDQIQKK